jgi:hypothetical protein
MRSIPMPTFRTSHIYDKLVEPSRAHGNKELINLYRLFCYGFRCGGFVDVIDQKLTEALMLSKNTFGEGVIQYLYRASNKLKQILCLREEAIPDDVFVIRRFLHYDTLIKSALEDLESASNNEIIKTMYETLRTSVEMVTNSNGLYILDWHDQFLLDNGAIDLRDQGIRILQGLFTNSFSYNYAIVSPGSTFYHEHSKLWEFHFIDDYDERCLYEHMREGKSFRIIDTDIISMRAGIAHGGYNPPNSIPVVLGFVSGDSRYGPWRLDFNDRTNPTDFEITAANNIKELNGVITKDHIEEHQGVKWSHNKGSHRGVEAC